MIWFKRTIFIVFLLVTILAVVGWFINWRYADDLETYALETFRSAISTDVSFDDKAEFSVWKDFPQIAVEIRNVRIQDSFRTDTLLSVSKVFVQFNLWKVLQNHIVIEGIRLTDGYVRLRRSEDDEWNFNVLQKKQKAEKDRNTYLSIEILTLEAIDVDYDDRAIGLNIQFYSEKSRIKGDFTNNYQRLALSLQGYLKRLASAGKDRVTELPVSLAGMLRIHGKEKIYEVEMGNAVLAGNEMVWDAEWRKTSEGTNMKLNVVAKNVRPDSLLPHLWPQMPETIRLLKLTGTLDLNLTMNGPFTKENGPELEASVSLNNGRMLFRNTQVSNMKLQGKLFMKDIKSTNAMRVSFSKFSLSTPEGQVSGSGTLTDLSNPYLSISTTGDSKIEEIIAVAGIAKTVTGKGNAHWDIDFSGPLGRDFKTTAQELKLMKWKGTLEFAETDLDFKRGIPLLKDLNAQITTTESSAIIDSCRGNIGHVHFRGNAELSNINRLMTDDDTPVDLVGSVHVRGLNIAKLAEEWKFGTEGGDERKLNVSLRLEADSLLYHHFTAQHIKGFLQIANKHLHVSELRFDALGGHVSSDLSYSPTANGSELQIQANVLNVDMSRTLLEWDNFGQTTVTSDNMQGKATADLEANVSLDPDYQIQMDKLNMETDISISGGRLIDFEPLMAMSKFISVDELKDVRFDTLQNHLSISNSRITIPRMTVTSNILNVDVFGEQGFNQEMDYHVNLLLNDLLRRRSKKQQTFEGHEIIDNHGKTRLYLWLRGRPGKMKVGFDKREVRRKLKDDLKKEGQTIKQLFNGEYEDGQQEEPSLQLQLEDDEIPDTTEQDVRPKTNKRKPLFDEDQGTDDTEGQFEIEFDP